MIHQIALSFFIVYPPSEALPADGEGRVGSKQRHARYGAGRYGLFLKMNYIHPLEMKPGARKADTVHGGTKWEFYPKYKDPSQVRKIG
jgi:hypothetical protein